MEGANDENPVNERSWRLNAVDPIPSFLAQKTGAEHARRRVTEAESRFRPHKDRAFTLLNASAVAAAVLPGSHPTKRSPTASLPPA